MNYETLNLEKNANQQEQMVEKERKAYDFLKFHTQTTEMYRTMAQEGRIDEAAARELQNQFIALTKSGADQFEQELGSEKFK